MLADSGVLGADLLVWLVLALGAAMVVGYGLALVRPPSRRGDAGRSGGRGAGGRGSGGRGAGGRRPPARRPAGRQPRGRANDLPEAPLGRSLVMIGIGTIAMVWSLATLVTR